MTRIKTKLSLIRNLKGTNMELPPKFKEINVIDLIDLEKNKESFAIALKPWKNPRLFKKQIKKYKEELRVRLSESHETNTHL